MCPMNAERACTIKIWGECGLFKSSPCCNNIDFNLRTQKKFMTGMNPNDWGRSSVFLFSVPLFLLGLFAKHLFPESTPWEDSSWTRVAFERNPCHPQRPCQIPKTSLSKYNLKNQRRKKSRWMTSLTPKTPPNFWKMERRTRVRNWCVMYIHCAFRVLFI